MTTAFPLADVKPGQVVQTELTLEQFLAIDPDTYEPPYLEYEGEGLVRRKMSPNLRHSELQAYLGYLFVNYGAQTGRRIHVYTELRTTTGGRSRLPDVAVYIGQRPRESQRRHAIDVADLSIEIASPDDSRLQLRAKCQWYLDQGGKLAMLIDPERREVSVFGKGEFVELEQDTENRFPALALNEIILEFNELLPGLNLSPNVIFQVLDR